MISIQWNIKNFAFNNESCFGTKNFSSISIILEDENNTLHNDLLLFNLYLEHLISVCNVWLCEFKNNSCVVYRSSSNIGNTTPYSIKIESHTINSLVWLHYLRLHMWLHISSRLAIVSQKIFSFVKYSSLISNIKKRVYKYHCTM